MDLELAGQVVVVTGAASGIGAATARAFAAEGATVAALDRDGAALAGLSADLSAYGRCVPVTADLSTAEGVDTAFATVGTALGAVDILVNNVGVCVARDFDDISDEVWLDTFSINFLSAVRACRHVLPAMRAQRRGVIVNNASDLARQPEAAFCDYQVSKAALVSLTKSLALREGPHVRINAVAPGPILTALWTKPGGFAETLGQHYGLEPSAAVEAELAKRQMPLARMGSPEEVAAVIVFLASPAAAFVTSSVWGVDGGSIRGLL